MKPNWRRVGAWLIVGTLLALVSAVIAWRVVMHGEVARIRREVESNYRARGGAFLSDLRALGPSPFTQGANADAGPTLNPRFQWIGKQSVVAEWAAKTPGERLPELGRPLLDRLASWGDKWVEHDADPDVLAATASSWLDGLSPFDHWDLDAHSPAEDVTKYAAFERPLPTLAPLLAWSKVRLLQGLHDGKGAEAGKVVRHVASLLHSTETTLGGAMAISLLELERAAHDKVGPTGDWTAVDAETTKRMRRLLFSLISFAGPYAPSDLAAQAFDPKLSSFGRCSAIAEGVERALMVRFFLQGPMRPRYDELEALLTKTGGCRLRGIRKAWTIYPAGLAPFTGTKKELCAKTTVSSAEEPEAGMCMPWIYTHVIPGGREDIGHILAAMGEAGALRAYATP